VNKILLSNFPKILIYLVPLFLITGPFLSDLAVTLVSIIFLIIVFKEKIFYVFDNIFFKLFALFYLYIVFNSLVNNQNLDSLRISITYIRFGLFSLAVTYFLNQDLNLLKKILYCLIFCFLILILDGIFQYFYGQNFLGFELVYPGPRVSSLFRDELILGSYLSRLFPILFALSLFFYHSNKQLYFLLGLSVLTLFLVFLSGERTALFLIILTLILMFFLIFKNKSFFKKVFYSAAILTVLILSFSETLRTRIIDVTIKEMFLNDTKNKTYIFTRQHDEHYTSAIRMFKKNIILGVGVKNFRNFCDEEEFNISDYTCSPHPHSTYIQLLSEIGIVGFLFILMIFIILNYKLGVHWIKCLNNKPLFKDFEVCLLISIYLTLWPIIPSGNFFNNWLNIIYFYPIGIIIWALSDNIGLKKPTKNLY
tara:strand:+ start:2989 stop:4257 length:1269 start_codon:yes stop_codon:yes gene_type:complete